MELSIIIPVFNAAVFLNETLDHLLSQVSGSIEIILVDDGSTDTSKSICEEYADRYDFIETIFLPHSGVSVARNSGLKIAKGKFIYFFDSDDRLEEKTLEYFIHLLQRNNTLDSFVFGWKTLRDDGSQKYYVNKNYGETLFENGEDFFKLFLTRRIECNNCNIIYSRSFLEKISLTFTEGATRGEDVEFFIKAFSAAKSVMYSSRVSFIYMIRSNSTTQAYTTYPSATLESFVRNKKVLETVRDAKSSVIKEINFYIGSLYVAHLYYYLKSKDLYDEANEVFLIHKSAIGKQRLFYFPHSLVMWGVKCSSLRLLFKLKKILKGK